MITRKNHKIYLLIRFIQADGTGCILLSQFQLWFRKTMATTENDRSRYTISLNRNLKHLLSNCATEKVSVVLFNFSVSVRGVAGEQRQ